ncbi:hypothetical protein POTOM_029397 [Populus tomentosa]|uniref:RRM domain-containing protein n=1 Tax=Populus tomentosa TaxID=118781 RepID=A0A8X7ZA63_POPTO|nr:hypothetical protein POTOM_029397 [Populus tomentosa]
MRRYSPPYHSSPRRGHGGRGRSPPRRGRGRSPPRRGRGGGGSGGGGYGRSKDQNSGSLLVRNIPRDCRPEELRGIFERFGVVRDVYIPRDYNTGEPRGFGFVQFVEPYDAMEAQHHMNGQVFGGRQMFVVVAAETRKRPEEMRHKARVRGPADHGGQSSYSRRSRSFSRSPRHYHVSRSRYQSRSYSPAPQRRDYSPSPERRYADHLRSPRGPPLERDGGHSCRLYSPQYGHGDDLNKNNNGFGENAAHVFRPCKKTQHFICYFSVEVNLEGDECTLKSVYAYKLTQTSLRYMDLNDKRKHVHYRKLAYDFVEARAWRPSPGRPSSSPS